MKTIERKKIIEIVSGKRIIISTKSFERGYDNTWANCLYISFNKAHFPELKYPEIVEGYLDNLRFDYDNGDLAKIDWHGGITFYSETFDIVSGITIVKAGCDFQHFGDEHWESKDSGEEILEIYADSIKEQFIILLESVK